MMTATRLIRKSNAESRYHSYIYDHFGNLIHPELVDGEVQNYFYDLHDQLVKAEIFKKDGSQEVAETSFPHDLSGNDLESHTRFVWNGIHLFQEVSLDCRYTYPDSYEPLAQVHNRTNMVINTL